MQEKKNTKGMLSREGGKKGTSHKEGLMMQGCCYHVLDLFHVF